MSDEPGFIDPTVKKQRARVALAPRPLDLNGKTVGLLDNTKEQGDHILVAVADALTRDYGVARVVIERKEYFSRPAADQLLDRLAQEVDVAISALGG